MDHVNICFEDRVWYHDSANHHPSVGHWSALTGGSMQTITEAEAAERLGPRWGKWRAVAEEASQRAGLR